MRPTLDQLRRYAVRRTFFPPTSLSQAVAKLGFLQADPIRAPARAQDLTLRHRVKGYRAGDLERRYPSLELEEDVFVNYGFLPRAHQALLHPRRVRLEWLASRMKRARAVLDYVREQGEAHPRDVDVRFGYGTTTNWFGGGSRTSTRMLDLMHYQGMLRVVRREGGTRVYAVQKLPDRTDDPVDRRERIDSLVDIVVNKYAPLPGSTLTMLVSRLRFGAPDLTDERTAALGRAKTRLASVRIDGVDWYWPAEERIGPGRFTDGTVRLLTPFDPLVWDRRRFELFWGWVYRFEAYTPAPKRKLGYYALPLLWRDRVIGWGNVAGGPGALRVSLGYLGGAAPADPVFRRELDAELDRMRWFLEDSPGNQTTKRRRPA
jgi:uncharacterized protein YcaQ